LLFAGAQFSGSHINHYKTRLTPASQRIPTPGPFFCAWNRSSPTWVGAPDPGKRSSESDFDCGGPLVLKMSNDFPPSLTLGHRFVLLGHFQHCALSDGVTHEVCLRLRPLGLEPPIFGLQSLSSLRHAKHLWDCSVQRRWPSIRAIRTLPRSGITKAILGQNNEGTRPLRNFLSRRLAQRCCHTEYYRGVEDLSWGQSLRVLGSARS
jgi:hypothetical protein